MILSSRIKDVNDSITLKLNETANKLAESGKKVFNLTAGQLPFRPHQQLVDAIESELKFLKSFQYSPVAGMNELRGKLIHYIESTRGVVLSSKEYDCVISNGGKHSIYNALGALVNPGDEVIMFAPYWISYPEMVKFWGGVPVVIHGQSYNSYIPSINDIKKAISPRTKAIILNCPNNPTGIHYPRAWMEEFANLCREHDQFLIFSDEIYYELSYYDPKPYYFYQHAPELLPRTLIFDGISKSLACTGLRIGYCISNKELSHAMSKLQGQTASGASSLVQMALIQFDFSKINEFITPIRIHLRSNADRLREKFREKNLGHAWYQTTSAFYFMIDFSQTPIYKNYLQKDESVADYSEQICEDLLQQHGVAIVPGTDFGLINSGRMSIVLEESSFMRALDILTDFLAGR